MIVIAGGTGTFGRLLVRQLAGRGERVRVLARTPEQLSGLGARRLLQTCETRAQSLGLSPVLEW